VAVTDARANADRPGKPWLGDAARRDVEESLRIFRLHQGAAAALAAGCGCSACRRRRRLEEKATTIVFNS
jgi:hypothetical protein